jgi:hypothetical protein
MTGAALQRLVLGPLGIADARIAESRDDLACVEMGEAASYHPGWVFHGLMVGPLHQAALLLARLMTGTLLPRELLAQMRSPLDLGPWAGLGYGLGLGGDHDVRHARRRPHRQGARQRDRRLSRRRTRADGRGVHHRGRPHERRTCGVRGAARLTPRKAMHRANGRAGRVGRCAGCARARHGALEDASAPSADKRAEPGRKHV